MNKPDLNAFLSELTWLSIKYDIGITSDGVLFEMEPEDEERRYNCDNDSRLDFQ